MKLKMNRIEVEGSNEDIKSLLFSEDKKVGRPKGKRGPYNKKKKNDKSYAQQRYAKLKAAGKCVKCKKKVKKGTAYCPQCIKYYSKKNKK